MNLHRINAEHSTKTEQIKWNNGFLTYALSILEEINVFLPHKNTVMITPISETSHDTLLFNTHTTCRAMIRLLWTVKLTYCTIGESLGFKSISIFNGVFFR